MAFRPLQGQTEAQLLTARAEAQADFLAGKTLSAYGAGDVSSSKLVQMTPQQRLEAIAFELYNLNPVTYPLNKRVTRTRIVFNSDPAS